MRQRFGPGTVCDYERIPVKNGIIQEALNPDSNKVHDKPIYLSYSINHQSKPTYISNISSCFI